MNTYSFIYDFVQRRDTFIKRFLLSELSERQKLIRSTFKGHYRLKNNWWPYLKCSYDKFKSLRKLSKLFQTEVRRQSEKLWDERFQLHSHCFEVRYGKRSSVKIFWVQLQDERGEMKNQTETIKWFISVQWDWYKIYRKCSDNNVQKPLTVERHGSLTLSDKT